MSRKLNVIYATICAVCLWTGAGFFTAQMQSSTVLTEGFEAGGKTAYTAANVTLGSGSWYLNEALTGNTSSDRKTGSYSARVRETGSLRMNFNVSSAGTVMVQHAKYGSDATSTWELWKSTNSGSTWAKVGATATTSSTTLQNASFMVNNAGAIRFEIRKVSGAGNRINFDNISITSYVAATPTPTPTPIPTATPTPPVSTNVHLTMGNPSNAVTDVNEPKNYLMVKTQYALSYNRNNATPNWTSWHLDSSWLGSTPRQDDFRADSTLPIDWYQAKGSSYSGSGYDRGHMTPSGDRTSSVANNSATFLMTNMIPQAPANNQGPWATLEAYCRTLVTQGNELYIISGGHGISGYIAGGYIAVPTYTWKVIMVLPNGSKDVSRVTSATRTIAVIMPNNSTVNSDWRTARISVDEIESLTEFDFFSNVSPMIQDQIESTVDRQFVDDYFISPEFLKEALEEAKAESSDVKTEETEKKRPRK